MEPRDLDAKVRTLARALAGDLARAAESAGSEADFRRMASELISAAAEDAGVPIEHRDEVFVARGRADSVYNRFVLEYKRPGLLREQKNAVTNLAAVNQIQDYIAGLAKKEWRAVTRFAGAVTDGHWLIFVRAAGPAWVADEPVRMSAEACERFLRLLFALAEGTALIPENLISDFGPAALTAHRAVRALHGSLARSDKPPLVDALFRQWQEFFGEVTEYGEWSGKIEAKKEFRASIRGMKLDPATADAPRVFFALHTYYALLVKLIALRAATRFAPGSGIEFAQWAGLPPGELKSRLQDLERRVGANNT